MITFAKIYLTSKWFELDFIKTTCAVLLFGKLEAEIEKEQELPIYGSSQR